MAKARAICAFSSLKISFSIHPESDFGWELELLALPLGPFHF
jgi:hypothetical protein